MAAKRGRRREHSPRAPASLRYRVPNPPPAFVGRDAEVELLAAALGRGPASLVVGPSGVGRTALALHALHRKLRKRLDRAVYLALPPGESGAQVRHELLRALSHVLGDGQKIDWPGLQGDAEALTATILETAERGKAWVLLDEVDCGDGEVAQLLSDLASFARASHWIACTSMVPEVPALRGQSVVLEAMSSADLAQLAQHWEPGLPSELIQRAADASAGSPWLLRQLLTESEARIGNPTCQIHLV